VSAHGRPSGRTSTKANALATIFCVQAIFGGEGWLWNRTGRTGAVFSTAGPNLGTGVIMPPWLVRTLATASNGSKGCGIGDIGRRGRL